jgi:hypothetical protein
MIANEITCENNYIELFSHAILLNYYLYLNSQHYHPISYFNMLSDPIFLPKKVSLYRVLKTATAALAVDSALAGFWPVTKRPSTMWKSSQMPRARSSSDRNVSYGMRLRLVAGDTYRLRQDEQQLL